MNHKDRSIRRKGYAGIPALVPFIETYALTEILTQIKRTYRKNGEMSFIKDIEILLTKVEDATSIF